MPTKIKLEKETYLKRSFEVLSHKTASFFSESESEKYADVLGTPFLIADMERVCAEMMTPLLLDGEVSVGAHIDVRHLAPTAVGANYEIIATYVSSRWGMFTFTVEAKDSVGIIGKGQIVRAIGSNLEILKRAKRAT